MAVFYIADTHFGHENIIHFCGRPFGSAREMNRVLAERWNAKVGDSDDVYVLGDFAYRCGESVRDIARGLNGRKHLVIGNHDHKWMRDAQAVAEFADVAPLLEIEDENRAVTLCHYPMMAWRNSGHEFSWLVHGHIHNDVRGAYWPLLRSTERALNAGVDVNGFEPVTFDELLANNVAWKSVHTVGSNACAALIH